MGHEFFGAAAFNDIPLLIQFLKVRAETIPLLRKEGPETPQDRNALR
jgi:hypothetical protein